MKESINNAFLFGLVMFFLAVIIAILVGSLSYSKAFKVKNRIITIIEKNLDYNGSAKLEIDEFLREIGYKTNPLGRNRCPSGHGVLLSSYGTNYRYCVYFNEAGHKGYYFKVAAFMYFEIPVIGDFLEFPIYGETKIIYDLDIT